MKKAVVLTISLSAILILFAAFALLLISCPQKNAVGKVIKIESGASVGEVAVMLKKEGIIRSQSLFRIFLRLSGSDKKIQAGTYKFKPGIGLAEIIDMLRNGKTATVQVTIPEGSTTRAIAEILDKAGVCKKQEFILSAGNTSLAKNAGLPAGNFEGFLFPDTYFFPENENPETIILAMSQNFFMRLARITGGLEVKPRELFDKVVLASIVEREYRVPSEAKLIASVFMNRLKIGMALQSCATVVYVITEKLGKPHPSVVHYTDLAIKDPYNTYLHRGLTPGPISNPGETALRAVFNPQKSDYLYFRLMDSSDGSHKFSKTFEEHVQESIPVKGF